MTDSRIGKRLEIAPHYDLWMRGARYGAVVRVTKSRKTGAELLVVQMDHPQVRRPIKIAAADGVQQWL